jgi:hypothetical protein
MRRTNNRPETAKICPLLDGQKCLKEGCEIYNDLINRCNISVIAYNMYRLSDVMNRQLEAADKPAL